mmetsp:Transcript_13762/g.36887  ORF Transcript_13762/g.36887 Transcript_13762/m.36887 type:complete len:258 (+) Transcript_13762:1158-1931(+)
MTRRVVTPRTGARTPRTRKPRRRPRQGAPPWPRRRGPRTCGGWACSCGGRTLARTLLPLSTSSTRPGPSGRRAYALRSAPTRSSRTSSRPSCAPRPQSACPRAPSSRTRCSSPSQPQAAPPPSPTQPPPCSLPTMTRRTWQQRSRTRAVLSPTCVHARAPRRPQRAPVTRTAPPAPGPRPQSPWARRPSAKTCCRQWSSSPMRSWWERSTCACGRRPGVPRCPSRWRRRSPPSGSASSATRASPFTPSCLTTTCALP